MHRMKDFICLRLSMFQIEGMFYKLDYLFFTILVSCLASPCSLATQTIPSRDRGSRSQGGRFTKLIYRTSLKRILGVIGYRGECKGILRTGRHEKPDFFGQKKGYCLEEVRCFGSPKDDSHKVMSKRCQVSFHGRTPQSCPNAVILRPDLPGCATLPM